MHIGPGSSYVGMHRLLVRGLLRRRARQDLFRELAHFLVDLVDPIVASWTLRAPFTISSKMSSRSRTSRGKLTIALWIVSTLVACHRSPSARDPRASLAVLALRLSCSRLESSIPP